MYECSLVNLLMEEIKIKKKKILNLGIKPDFYLKYNRISGLVGEWKSGTTSLNTDSQWSKHEACFASSTQMWLDHNTSVTSDE